MGTYIKTADGSFETVDRKVLYFSTERFITEIGRGECCFICGVGPSDAPFNNEHVIPKWLLAKHGLYSKKVTLPNGARLSYGQYTLPCCVECNSLMGEKIETPVSRVLAGGLRSVREYLEKEGHWLIFLWLALIYLKTHLKDRHLRFHLDQRQGAEPISDLYDWAEMHHIHCMARAFFTGAHLDPSASGTLFTVPAATGSGHEHFDYRDTHHTRSVLLRTGDVAFVAVLDDSCACGNLFPYHARRFGWNPERFGEFSPLQLREFLAHLSFLNEHLAERPKFSSAFRGGRYEISARLPSEPPHLRDHRPEDLGRIVYACCEDVLSACENNTEETVRLVKQGRFTWLFDSNGEFRTNSMVFPE